MNDFTKDELESLLGALRYIDDDPAWRTNDGSGWDDDLAIKIADMIANYCDHDWQPTTGKHYQMQYSMECKHCGKGFR